MVERYTRRDYLAQDRTHLANERTLLSYWRTGLAFSAAGAFVVKFYQSRIVIILASGFIIFGVVLLIFGTKRFIDYKKHIDKR